MTKKRAICLATFSLLSLVYGLVSIFGYTGSEYIYIGQGETFSCSRSAYTVVSSHDHDFTHRQNASPHDSVANWWKDTGLDFDPLSCYPFYERAEAQDQTMVDFDKQQFFWFSRIEDVHPNMWQIYIEAVASPRPEASNTGHSFSMKFDIGIAVRGKDHDEETWHLVYE